jgi:hypothetical protein
MSIPPVVFQANGSIQSYVVPATGHYLIAAAGAQGGPGGGPGGKGARLQGRFFLQEGDTLQIVVGRQGTAGTTPHRPAGGGGGGSFVWLGRIPAPLPTKPLLAAGGGGGGGGGDGGVGPDGGMGAAPGGRNGRGGTTDTVDFHYSGGGGAGWLLGGDAGSSPTFCTGGTLWQGGIGASFCRHRGGVGGFGGGGGGAFLGQGGGGGGGFSGGGGGTQNGPTAGGGGSYNAGVDQENTPGAQTGDGCVAILAVSATRAPRPLLGTFNPFPELEFAADASDTAEARQWLAGGLEGRGYM